MFLKIRRMSIYLIVGGRFALLPFYRNSCSIDFGTFLPELILRICGSYQGLNRRTYHEVRYEKNDPLWKHMQIESSGRQKGFDLFTGEPGERCLRVIAIDGWVLVQTPSSIPNVSGGRDKWMKLTLAV